MLVLMGVVAIVKGMFFLKASAADKVTEWILRQPVIFLKIFAVCQIALGVLVIFLLKN